MEFERFFVGVILAYAAFIAGLLYLATQGMI